MSDQDIKQVSAMTGTFTALKLTPQEAPSGKTDSPSGNKLPEFNRQEMEVLAKKLNITNRSIGRDLRFQVDMESGRSVIQVLDTETGEIIRQIPPENAKTYVSDSGDMALRLYDKQV